MSAAVALALFARVPSDVMDARIAKLDARLGALVAGGGAGSAAPREINEAEAQVSAASMTDQPIALVRACPQHRRSGAPH